MTSLANSPCQSCQADSAEAVEEARARELLEQLPGWRIETVGGVAQLQKVFRFADFAEALAFTNAIGALGEAENHHPALLTEWGRVSVSWWTHSLKGLHINDFIMAARSDQQALQQHRQG
jgi:4a-hydroxytetrahydrobiopterin dehydratase